MSVDLYTTVLNHDGGEVDHDNLNNAQRFVQAQITDALLESLIGSISITLGKDLEMCGQNGSNVPTSRAYALHPGAAFLRQGSANNKIQVAPGVLLQKIANADGLKSTLLPFKFLGTEEWTLTAGDATDPRVDLLQMKLEYVDDTPASVDFQDAVTRALSTSPTTNTRRRVQCTLTVKAGTPAASPTIPEPDAGFVPVGSCMVGNTWAIAGTAPIFGVDTAATANLVVHDQRMPLGVRPVRVDPKEFWNAAGWTLSSDQSTISAPPGANAFVVPYTGPMGRLVGFAVHKISGTFPNGTTDLVRAGGVGATQSSTINGRNQLTLGATNPQNEVFHFYTFEAAHIPSAGPTILQSATTKIGVPLWSNGQRCLREYVRLAIADVDRVAYHCLRGAVSTHVIAGVTFFVAVGL